MASLLALTTPPTGDIAYVRGDAVLALLPAFPWSPNVMAREVKLATGVVLVVQDTADNVTAVKHALASVGATIMPTGPVARLSAGSSS